MFKRSLSAILCMILAIGSCLTLAVPVSAAYVSYTGSTSYMSGKYYQQLTGVQLTGNQADDIVNVALSQVGYHEGSSSTDLSGISSGSSNYTEYGRVMGSNPNAWCAYFASWCARRAEVNASVITAFAGCTSAVVNFKSGNWNSAGVWHDGYILNHNTTYIPKKGDLIFYDWEQDFYYNSSSDYLSGGVNHVGIVWKDSTSKNTVYVVEGNTSSNDVAKKTVGQDRSVTEVVGYFSPAYSGASANSVTITSPANMQYLDPRAPGKVTWNAFSGAKSYSYTVREVQYNSSTGKYDETSTYLCSRVCTTAKSFSLNKDENSNLNGYVKNWGAYKIWVGACSDTSGSTVIADQIIYVCLNHIAKTPDLKKPFASSKTQIMSNLYTDTYSGTVSPDQDLTISWSSEGQSYDYSIKALSGKPNPGESESGTTLESASKYKSTSVTVSKSTLQQYAGQYIKVYLKTNDSSCDDSSCAAYYYFKLGEAQPTTYTLTYNANGGSGAPSAQSGNTKYTISTIEPRREGYSFLGWSTSRYADEADYTAGDSITLTKNMTLYAVWEEILLTSVKVKRTPTKTEYEKGETFDSTGLTLTATYSDGSTKTITSGFTCTGFDPEAEGTQTITVTYEGKKTTFIVEVIPEPVVLTKIAVKTQPTKTEYEKGETFDSTGLTLTATYSDGSTKTITSGFTCTGFDPEAEGEQTITVTYEGKKTTFTVEVIPEPVVPEIILTKIAVKTMPYKTEYEVGETFDSTGLTLTATYSDGSSKTITSSFTCTGFDPEAEGEQTITVTYEGKKTTFTVEVINVIPNNTPQMKLSRTSARAGDRVNVTLSVENNPGIIATSVNLSYDTAALRLVEVKNGTIFNSFLAGNDLNAVPFTVIWEDALAAQDYTGEGILATFTFEVLSDAPIGTTPVTLNYKTSSTFNIDLEEVRFTTGNGSVEIVDRTPGDVNGDGEVNLKDVVALSRYQAGGWNITINESNADVNGDQMLTTKDIVILKRYLTGGWNVELK